MTFGVSGCVQGSSVGVDDTISGAAAAAAAAGAAGAAGAAAAVSKSMVLLQ